MCAGSLILLALLTCDMQKRLPDIASLFRKCSYIALAGSSLFVAASLRFFIGLEVVPAFAVALAGLALTLSGAILLEWLLRDIHLDGPLPCESELMARLPALQEIVAGSAWRGGTQWVAKLPPGGALTKKASSPHSCKVA